MLGRVIPEAKSWYSLRSAEPNSAYQHSFENIWKDANEYKSLNDSNEIQAVAKAHESVDVIYIPT